MRLRKNLHSREVDVAGLREPDGKAPQVHLVEAKILNKGHSFEECFSQIDSVRDSGDRLWVAVPEAQWRSLPETDRQRNVRRLKEFHFGLLLVAPEKCHAEIGAPLNPAVTASGRTEVLQQLGFAIDPFLPQVPSLGGVEAKNAASTMALTCMVADILYEVVKKRVTFNKFWEYLYDSDSVTNGWFLPTVELSETVYCALDPFGRLLKDSIPAAWVSVVVSVEDISAVLESGSGFGTHVYVEDGEWQWKAFPVADGNQAIKYWRDRGLDHIANLCVRIEIVGRLKSALESDLRRVINEATEFRPTSEDSPPTASKK